MCKCIQFFTKNTSTKAKQIKHTHNIKVHRKNSNTKWTQTIKNKCCDQHEEHGGQKCVTYLTFMHYNCIWFHFIFCIHVYSTCLEWDLLSLTKSVGDVHEPQYLATMLATYLLVMTFPCWCNLHRTFFPCALWPYTYCGTLDLQFHLICSIKQRTHYPKRRSGREGWSP